MTHLESYNILFLCLYILQCSQLPVTNYTIAPSQMNQDLHKLAEYVYGTFSYLIWTHLFISYISCPKVVCPWAHPTELQRVTDLEMIAKAFVDDQLTAFKRLWKDICKVTEMLLVN